MVESALSAVVVEVPQRQHESSLIDRSDGRHHQTGPVNDDCTAICETVADEPVSVSTTRNNVDTITDQTTSLTSDGADDDDDDDDDDDLNAPISPPTVARKVLEEKGDNDDDRVDSESHCVDQTRKQEQEQEQTVNPHTASTQRQLEERVEELEEKLATLSRLLVMQQQQQQQRRVSASRERRKHQKQQYDDNDDDDSFDYYDDDQYHHNNNNNNVTSSMLSVTPPGSPSHHHSRGRLMNFSLMGGNGRRRIDGAMPVLESPAPSRRPTMELQSTTSSYEEDEFNDYDRQENRDVIGRQGNFHLHHGSTDGNNGCHGSSRVSRHQRNLSYRVFNTNEFETAPTTPSPDDELKDDQVEDRGGRDVAGVVDVVPDEVQTEGFHEGRRTQVPEIVQSSMKQQSDVDIDLMLDHHNHSPGTNNKTDSLQSMADVTSDQQKQSGPGISLPYVCSEDGNYSSQHRSKSDNITILNKTRTSLDDKTSSKLPNFSLLTKSTTVRNSIVVNDDNALLTTNHDSKSNSANLNPGESPDKKSRVLVAPTLSSPADGAESTPSSQKNVLKRERSLSLVSVQSNSTRVTNRSDSQGTPKVSSTGNSAQSTGNTNIKSKWLDYLNSVQESNYDTDKQMEEFVKVPSAVEGLLSYGFWICVDSFLYTLTILPIRFVWSCLLLVRFAALRVWQSSVPEGPFRFNRRHFYQLILVGIIYIIYATVLKPIDISIIYHWIRVQNMVKLYLLIAIVEVFDRLMCSLGQDCLDSLYWNTTRRPRSSRLIVSIAVVLTYTALHSILLFIHVATINVAMNSSDQALLSLLIGGNFAEIKSTVFKKYNKAALFNITASDVCERFKLALFLVLVMSLNLSQGMDKKMLVQYFHMCGIVWCAEWLSDWIKHAFITKFNYIASGVYSEYGLLLAGDVTGMGHEHINLNSTHSVVRRLGLAQIPLVCVMFKYLREAYKYATYEYALRSWVVVVGFSVAWSFLMVCKLSLGSFLHKISMQKLEAAPAFSKTQSTVAKKKN